MLPGARLNMAIEQASGAASHDANDIHGLETEIRSFINAVYAFESQETDSESSPKIDREDTFRTFEVDSLSLLRKLKRVTIAGKEKTSESKQAKKRVKILFVNPRKNLKKTKFSCPHCKKIYESLKSLQNHVRLDHKDLKKVSVNDFQQGEPLIQCMLLKKNKNPCQFKSITSQMGRHCESKSLHSKVHKRPTGKQFRGWRFLPGHTEVYWCSPSDPDPPSEEELEMDVSDDEGVSGNLLIGNKEDRDGRNEDLNSPEPRNESGANKEADVGKQVSSLSSVEEPVFNTPEIFGQISPTRTQVTKENSEDSSHDSGCGDDSDNKTAKFVGSTTQPQLTSEVRQTVSHDDPLMIAASEIFADAPIDDDIDKVHSSPVSDHPEALFLVNTEDPLTQSIVLGRKELQNLDFSSEDISKLQKIGGGYTLNASYNEDFQVIVEDVLLTSTAAPDKENSSILEIPNNDNDIPPASFILEDPSPVDVCEDAPFHHINEYNENSCLYNTDIDLSGDNDNELPSMNLDFDKKASVAAEMSVAEISPELVQSAQACEKSSDDETSQESITCRNLTPPSSLKNVSDAVTRIVAVSVQQPKIRVEKGTVGAIWTVPFYDKYFPSNKSSTLNDGNNSKTTESSLIETSHLSPPAEDVADESLPKTLDPSSANDDDDLLEDSDSEDSELDEIDSEYDENLDVDVETTRARQERRKVRHLNRAKTDQDEIAERPENATFIAEFLEWLKTITKEATTNKEPSTFPLSSGHGWEYHDSFLHFQTSEDPSFSYARLVDFENPDNFLFIPSPVDWILRANGNPIRKREQLKLSKRLRKFVAFKALKHKFTGKDSNFKVAISEHLRSIDAEIADQNLYSKFDKQYKIEAAKTKKMKMIINPEGDQLEYEAVKVFLRSEEAKNLLKEVDDIYKEAKQGRIPKPRKFNRCCLIVRFFIAIKDKNRVSIYGFTNMDYLTKIPAWLPDLDRYVWSLDDLPPEWKMYKAPESGSPPTCWELRLDGSNPGTKGQAKTNVIIDRQSYELAEKYDFVKKKKFGEQPGTDPFFINSQGKKIARLQKTKGSLVEIFGKVIGRPDFRMTHIRKGSLHKKPFL